MGFKQPGEAVAVTLVHQGGETKTVTLRLARAPSDIKPGGDPIYDGGRLDPVIVEARRDPTARSDAGSGNARSLSGLTMM